MLYINGKLVRHLKRLVLVLVIVLVAASISFQYFGVGFDDSGALVRVEELRNLSDTSTSSVGTALANDKSAESIDQHGFGKGGSDSSTILPQATNLEPLQPDVDLSALESLCSATQWQTGLYLACEPMRGGVGNVALFFLGCVRYAIHVGARLIIPDIQLRKLSDLGVFSGQFKGFSYMFDEQYTISALNKACPQLAAGSKRINDFSESQLLDWIRGSATGPDPAADLSVFRGKLDTNKMSPTPTWAEPKVARMYIGFVWPTYVLDTPEFFDSFGNILRFHDVIYELANAIVAQLAKETNKYLGVHLRTEQDTPPGRWLSYENQSTAYLNKAIEKGYQAIFVASGNANHTAQFKQEVAVRNIKCLTKSDLLSGEQAETLKSLGWDHQGLVDFIVLMQSDYFMGIRDSSFSTLVAFTRHVRLNTTDRFKVPGDELSGILGDSIDQMFDVSMFPTAQFDLRSPA